MTLKLFSGLVEAFGSESELACYTMMVIEILKNEKEREDRTAAEKEISVMQEMLSIPFEELIRRERDGGNTGGDGEKSERDDGK